MARLSADPVPAADQPHRELSPTFREVVRLRDVDDRRLADAEAGRSSKKKTVIAPLPKLSYRESARQLPSERVSGLAGEGGTR